jgi:hypothetical protein
VPSAAHQTLLLWAARKMARDGFRVSGYDGRSEQGGVWNALPAPPTLGGVRPDAWGYDPTETRLAFAEAKTGPDIDTEHTRAQLRAFVRLRSAASAKVCRLYLATPRSATYAVDRVLADVGLAGARDVVRLHVPDVLLRESGE